MNHNETIAEDEDPPDLIMTVDEIVDEYSENQVQIKILDRSLENTSNTDAISEKDPRPKKKPTKSNVKSQKKVRRFTEENCMYKCNICDMEFFSYNERRLHKKRVHVQTLTNIGKKIAAKM